MILELKFDGGVVGIPYACGLRSPEERHEFVDLRANPRAIDELPEPKRWPELRSFLEIVNYESGAFLTLGCECAASSGKYTGGMTHKVTSYVQVTFADFVIAKSEEPYFVLYGRLNRAMQDRLPGEPLMVAFDMEQFGFTRIGIGGLCVSVWVGGFGMDADAARSIWAEGLQAIADFFRGESASGRWGPTSRLNGADMTPAANAGYKIK